MNKLTQSSSLILCLIGMLTLLIFLAPVTDADLGWHLRYGDYFWAHRQLLAQNTFSWAMSDYQWINHSWGYDLLVSAVFKYTGFLGLSMFGSVIITLAFALSASLIRHNQARVVGIIFISYLCFPLLYTGPKSQHLSLLFSLIIWYCLETGIYTTYRFVLPALFLFWTNLHGQFILGLSLLWLYSIGQLILHAQWQFSKLIHNRSLQVAIISSLSTFINPYSWHLHLDLLQYQNSPVLSQVTEWQPWGFSGHLPLLLTGYSGMLFWWSSKQFRRYLPQLLVIIPLAYLAFSARRMIPVYLLISLPLFVTIMGNNITSTLNQTRRFVVLLLTFCIVYFSYQTWSHPTIWHQTWNTYCQTEIQCSEPVISFLQSNYLQGKLFNAYRLGGHLLYRYPQLPVYIDGRMTLWHSTNGYTPFLEYWNIIHTLPGGQQQLEQLDVDYVLINQQYNLARALTDYEHWPILFQDDHVILFKNPHHQL